MAKGQQKIKMIKTVQVGRVPYVGGKVYEVDADTAKSILDTKLGVKYDGDDTPIEVRKQPLAVPGKDPKLETDEDDPAFKAPGDEDESDEEDADESDEDDADESDEDEEKTVRKPRKKRKK